MSQKNSKFDIIHYSNCWEDTDILLQALNVQKGGNYLSIASSGDNTLSILSHNPSLVLAVDLNPAQMACLEIRKAAFSNLSYPDLLKFLGIREGINRLAEYRKLRIRLSHESQQFWDNHEDFIYRGISHVGKFETYFRLFRNWILPVMMSKRQRTELLKKKTKPERFIFYENEVNSMRWRILFKFFFSRAVMGRFGREPEFFKYVEGDVASRIMQRTKYALTMLPTHNNPYLEYIITGNFKNTLPFYLQKQNFERIRNNLNRLVLYKGSLQEAIQANRKLKFDGFNLSDIFEYMSYSQYLAELERILRVANTGARLVYWNMLATRRVPDELQTRLSSLDDISQALFFQNKAFFYKALIIAEVQ